MQNISSLSDAIFNSSPLSTIISTNVIANPGSSLTPKRTENIFFDHINVSPWTYKGICKDITNFCESNSTISYSQVARSFNSTPYYGSYPPVLETTYVGDSSTEKYHVAYSYDSYGRLVKTTDSRSGSQYMYYLCEGTDSGAGFSYPYTAPAWPGLSTATAFGVVAGTAEDLTSTDKVFRYTQYDASLNPVSVLVKDTRAGSARDVTTRYSYNGTTNLLESITYPEGNAVWLDLGGATFSPSYVMKERMNLDTTTGSIGALHESKEITCDLCGRVTSEKSTVYTNTGETATLDLGKYPIVTNRYSYDGLGRVLSVGQTIQGASGTSGLTLCARSYDDTNLVVTTTDAKGYISEKQYDGFYRLITEKSYRPDTATRDATYTGSGKVLMGTTAYAYDSAYLGNLLTETVYGDASGASYERTSYSYDSLGRRTGVSRGNGTTMTPVATYSYDDTNNIVTEKGYQSPSAYSRTDTKRDWLGRVTGTTAWGGVNGTGTVYTTTQAYNYGGQVTGKTLPNGESYGYTYTRSGLLEGISYPNNRGSESRSYDGNGRLLTRTDVGSNVTSYAYDGADQETSRTSTAPGKAPITVTTSYSQWGPGTIIQTKNLEQELSIEYGYASRGQVASETRMVGSGSGQKSGTVTHAWDAAGNLSGLTVNGFDGTYAKSLSYSLPGFGGAMAGNGSARSVSVGVAGGDTIGRVSTLYSGVLDEVDYCGSAGTYTQYTNYDSMLRPQTIDHPGTDFDQSYGYDYKGNVTGWNGTSYTYDGLDRLSNGGAYTYDAISNMSSGPNATYSYLTNANANTMRLSAATLGGTTTGYSDDGNLGDLVSATGKYSSLTYDARNELVSLTDTGRSAGKSLTDSYAYGPDGLRYAKTESNADGTSTLTYYWYEGNSILYEEAWQGGTSVRDRLNVYAGGLNIGAYEKAAGVETLRYYYNDHLGSRRAVTDSTGAVLAKIDYSTWGLPTVTSSSGYDGTKDISYTGKEEDATGLYYFNARYYDPSIGRFITEDPIRSGLNWYAYCGNNPLSFTDPSGFLLEVGDDNSGHQYVYFPTTGDIIDSSGKDKDAKRNYLEYEKREKTNEDAEDRTANELIVEQKSGMPYNFKQGPIERLLQSLGYNVMCNRLCYACSILNAYSVEYGGFTLSEAIACLIAGIKSGSVELDGTTTPNAFSSDISRATGDSPINLYLSKTGSYVNESKIQFLEAGSLMGIGVMVNHFVLYYRGADGSLNALDPGVSAHALLYIRPFAYY